MIETKCRERGGAERKKALLNKLTAKKAFFAKTFFASSFLNISEKGGKNIIRAETEKVRKGRRKT